MVSYGLNTVRIPVGYWFLENIVDKSEHFPQGGEKYLDQVVGWAKDAGLYVIIVLHGAPGAQATDAFTGQLNNDPGFYSDYNYDRAYKWLEWITEKVHKNDAYKSVGTLELVNEPERTWDTEKYPGAAANAESMRKVHFCFVMLRRSLLTCVDLLPHGMVEDTRKRVRAERWSFGPTINTNDG